MFKRLVLGSLCHLSRRQASPWPGCLRVERPRFRCDPVPCHLIHAERRDVSNKAISINDFAVQDLHQIFQNGLLDSPVRDTAHIRRLARTPNHNISLANATPWIALALHIPPGECAVDYVRETMRSLREWVKVLPAPEAQSEILKASVGRQTLDWLISTDDVTRSACGWDLDLLRLLAHYLIAEGHEECLWDWIREEMSSRRPTRNLSVRAREQDQYSWIGRLLGSFANAHLARNPKRADKALQLLEKFVDLRAKKPAARAISSGALLVILSSAFRPGQYPHTDPALFERFVAIRCGDGLKGNWSGLEYQTALFSLLHPQRPDPDPLLKHFRSLESKPQARLFNPKFAKEASFQWSRCKDLADVLRHQSRHQDAEWVENFAKRFENIWRGLNRRNARRESDLVAKAQPSDRDGIETSPSDLMWMRRRR